MVRCKEAKGCCDKAAYPSHEKPESETLVNLMLSVIIRHENNSVTLVLEFLCMVQKNYLLSVPEDAGKLLSDHQLDYFQVFIH